MESNSKIPIYVVSNYQSYAYWFNWLAVQSVPTGVFYRSFEGGEPKMVQTQENLPTESVQWLEPFVLENGIAKVIPVEERPLFEVEWQEAY